MAEVSEPLPVSTSAVVDEPKKEATQHKELSVPELKALLNSYAQVKLLELKTLAARISAAQFKKARGAGRRPRAPPRRSG
jgi:hypothetical protein